MTKTHSPSKMIFSALCAFLALSVLVTVPMRANAAKDSVGVLAKHKNVESLSLTVGKAEILPLNGAVADVLVADPSVADVMAVQADKLYVVGSKIGTTNIIALDENGNMVSKINVNVVIDTDEIEAMIHGLFPKEDDVHVRATNSQVYLTGHVASPAVSQQIARLVAAHVNEVTGVGSGKAIDEIIENLLTVAGETQVTLRVRIMEVARDAIRELGDQTNINDIAEGSAPLITRTAPSSIADVTGNVISSGVGLSETPAALGRVLIDTGIGGIGFLELAIQALERENLVNILAEPNLTAVSGEQAGFLAGGEFPIPTGRDRDGNITIEYREFGVSLNFVPIVLSDDRISLQLSTEVSSLDFGQGITLADVSVPGLDVRRASTTVELGSGRSIMIAGLLRSETTKGMSGLPGIKDTPVLGDLISSRSFQRSETEMVVMITPYLVKPFAHKEAAAKDTVVVKNDQRSPLSDAFEKNLRDNYGNNIAHMPEKNKRFGYIID
ncbi:MAG: type II and III secretion system protein family protein [Pseudobdellovibrionaceae bacterium]